MAGNAKSGLTTLIVIAAVAAAVFFSVDYLFLGDDDSAESAQTVEEMQASAREAATSAAEEAATQTARAAVFDELAKAGFASEDRVDAGLFGTVNVSDDQERESLSAEEISKIAQEEARSAARKVSERVARDLARVQIAESIDSQSGDSDTTDVAAAGFDDVSADDAYGAYDSSGDNAFDDSDFDTDADTQADSAGASDDDFDTADSSDSMASDAEFDDFDTADNSDDDFDTADSGFDSGDDDFGTADSSFETADAGDSMSDDGASDFGSDDSSFDDDSESSFDDANDDSSFDDSGFSDSDSGSDSSSSAGTSTVAVRRSAPREPEPTVPDTPPPPPATQLKPWWPSLKNQSSTTLNLLFVGSVKGSNSIGVLLSDQVDDAADVPNHISVLDDAGNRQNVTWSTAANPALIKTSTLPTGRYLVIVEPGLTARSGARTMPVAAQGPVFVR